MFTQCQHCQAIFRVNMREVTVSKGMLRCGECMQIFDSSKSISTTMQEPFVPLDLGTNTEAKTLTAETLPTLKSFENWQKTSSENPARTQKKQTKQRQNPSREPTHLHQPKPKEKPANKFTVKEIEKSSHDSKVNWPLITAGLLGLLLCFQVAFNYRHLLLDKNRYEPEKIQMLNHNVFAHPIEKNVLLISASIENTADFDQPFPTLEVRLTNAKTELVALRRFSPNEYLDNYSDSTLLLKNRPTSIKLKIQDPGNQATRFQFNFL